MNKVLKPFLLLVTMLVVSSLACGVFSGGISDSQPDADSTPEQLPTSAGGPEDEEVGPALPTSVPDDEGVQPTDPVEGSAQFDTEFPLPENVQNFMKVPQFDAGINFQTDMNLEEVVAFYREEFTLHGLSERELLTVIDDSSFSMVFDGSPNGLAVILQGVVLGPDQTNVNIRYEDL